MKTYHTKNEHGFHQQFYEAENLYFLIGYHGAIIMVK
jgi:hypothetical protein